ncbi:hypothetical protein M8818_005681 [Zalaria obscura]|uniref:Uncharacterized protein n=1 Tax=Zalaria obscura TaxID=2024903 RepID=A0ACC3S9L1_9PEZI
MVASDIWPIETHSELAIHDLEDISEMADSAVALEALPQNLRGSQSTLGDYWSVGLIALFWRLSLIDGTHLVARANRQTAGL